MTGQIMSLSESQKKLKLRRSSVMCVIVVPYSCIAIYEEQSSFFQLATILNSHISKEAGWDNPGLLQAPFIFSIQHLMLQFFLKFQRVH